MDSEHALSWRLIKNDLKSFSSFLRGFWCQYLGAIKWENQVDYVIRRPNIVLMRRTRLFTLCSLFEAFIHSGKGHSILSKGNQLIGTELLPTGRVWGKRISSKIHLRNATSVTWICKAMGMISDAHRPAFFLLAHVTKGKRQESCLNKPLIAVFCIKTASYPSAQIAFLDDRNYRLDEGVRSYWSCK